MSPLEQAIEIALESHEDDTDKAGEPYIRHPLRVMEAMETDEERIAAVLHDVVEDADETLDDIECKFGTEIRDAVDALTRREEEGESYMEFVERAADNSIARRVKIADIEDNLDLTRLDSVKDDVLDNQEKYLRAWLTLQDAA
jgi:(p)ppGpp synthase/HD superfamily hydrolase